jgi:hypothetical protein
MRRMVRSRPGALAVVAGTLLLALGACGQAGNNTVAAPPAAATTPGAAGATPDTATSDTATAGATTQPPASPSAASPSLVIATISGNTYMFVTPSGNIGCAATTSGVRCDIGDRSWTAPTKATSCQLDYGNGVFVGPNGAGMTCAGDTLLHATTTVLAYGHGVRVGQILCVSQSTGVRCEYVPTGHGFTLAKEAYTLF